MSNLAQQLAPVLRERADPAWWARGAGESDTAWRDRTDSAFRQIGCSPTWCRASVGERRELLGELLSQSAEPDTSVEAG